MSQRARAVVLALFVPLIISSGGNSGSQATTLVIRAMALGAVLGTIGMIRIVVWQAVGPCTASTTCCWRWRSG